MAKAPVVQKDPKQADLLEEDPLLAAPETEQETEVAVEEEEEVQQEDATVLLQQQLEALRKSEEIHKTRAERYRSEAEESRRAAEAIKADAGKVRKDAVQSQYDSVSNTLTAATNEAESAKRDIKTASANGDSDALADAYERLAIARVNVSKLEDSKYELEARLKAPIQEETAPAKGGLPQRVQHWLQKHPEYVTDARKNDKIRSLHWEVIDEGHEFDSDEYIDSMETKLGLKQAASVDDEPVVPQRQPQQQRAPMVSAPVSREAPSTPGSDRNGQVRLSAAQREAAKIAGVSEKVYAENLNNINKMKANGTYGGQ